MKSKKSETMRQSLSKMLACPLSLVLLVIVVICPVSESKEVPLKEVIPVPKLAESSFLQSSSSSPKRQIPVGNRHAQAQPYPYNRNYNEERGDIRDTSSRHNQNAFQRRADVGSENNKRLSDNNYVGNRFLGSNNDVATGQKKDSQDTYDPFYFFQPQSRGQNLNQVNHQQQYQQPHQHQHHHHQQQQQQQTSYQRQRGDLHTSTIVNPPRNRRNSHNINNSHNNNYFDLNAEKYNILTKSAYPLDNQFAYANTYPASYRSHHNPPNAHHHHQHHNPNQFLSQDQLLRQGTNRHVHGSNSLDYYGGAGAYSNRGRGDVPWSVQIGTQLKVNDDGRAPNPTQFYIRDERTGPPHNRRHPIYRK